MLGGMRGLVRDEMKGWVTRWKLTDKIAGKVAALEGYSVSTLLGERFDCVNGLVIGYLRPFSMPLALAVDTPLSMPLAICY